MINAQGWMNEYIPLDPANQVTFDTKTINDTIWLSREDSLAYRSKSTKYSFPFKVSAGENVMFHYSKRIGGADPDFNCDFPKRPLQKGDSGKITICFPGRIMTPPYVHTQKYVVNSNSSERDLLVVNRHFKWIDRDTIHTKLSLGDSALVIIEHAINSKPDIIFLNLHENEATSIDALKVVADSIPIDYFYLEHGGERRVGFSKDKKQYSIDPNRIYTELGRVATLEENDQFDEFGLNMSDYLAEQIIRKLRRGRFIISVHNNTPDNYSIESYLPEGNEAANTGKLFINESADPDDFIYTTNHFVFEAAKRDQINVILQNEKTFVDDGSLSIYCGLMDKQYINVETEHGHLEEQVRLILWAKEVVEEFNTLQK